MRVTLYDMKRDFESGRPYLFKEKAVNYKSLKGICTPLDVYDICVDVLHMDEMATERSYILPLDCRHHLLGIFEHSHGGSNACPICPREVFQAVLMVGANGFILVHNHPSGDISPSEEDFDFTKRVRLLGNQMMCPMLDSVIIGGRNDIYSSYFSFADTDYFKMWDAEAGS